MLWLLTSHRTHNQTSFNEFVFEFTVFDVKNATKNGGGFLGEANLLVSSLSHYEISKLMSGIPSLLTHDLSRSCH